MATIKQIKDSAGTTHDIVDTKNTAGSTNSSSKLYLIGAASQAANPQTYSNINVYAENGRLYSSGITSTDNLVLSNNSTEAPKIIFQRRTSTDDYYDYQLSGETGGFKFSYSSTSGQGSVTNIATIDSNGNYSGNAATATMASKLGSSTVGSTKRPIYLNAGTPTVCNVGESFLSWGGANFAASWGPIDAAMIPELGSNRLEYYPGSKIKIEYSTDNGSTWSVSSATETEKSQIFSSGYSIYLGGSNATKVDKSQYQTRITLTTQSTLYSTLNKFAIRVSTSGSSNCWCSIDVRLQSNVESNTNTWVNVANQVTISGWSGWNIINTNGFTTYGNQKASQYGEIRFTFGATHSSSSEYPGLTIYRIKGFGGEGWTTPSNKALTGTIYTENSDQTTIWPNTLYPSSNKTINLGTSTRYWNNIHAAHVYIGGTANNTTAKITSDTATNMYFDVGEVNALMVLNGSDKTIRSGSSHANTVNLGASNVPFKNIYGTTIYENGTSLDSKYQAKGSYAKTNSIPTTAVEITSANETGIYYVNGTRAILGQQDGALITNKYSDSWISQIYQDYRTGKIALRGKNNGTWTTWLKPSYEGHTHNYAGSSSAGGAANSVVNEMTIKLNSGTTEGTNLFTYNGSAAKTINITPMSIGASALYNVYSISHGEGAKYYKLLSITPTSSQYGDMHYEFDVAGRNNIRGSIKIFIRTTYNKKYINIVSIKYSGNIGNDIKAYKYRNETSETDTVELWMKVGSYDTLKIFPKTHYVYSALPVIWSDFTASTGFPTDFTEEITISEDTYYLPSNNVTGSGTSGYLAKWNGTNSVTNGPAFGSGTTTYLRNDGTWATPPDTKNTAGSTNSSSKLFLIGATSQAANPQTYSHDTAYVGTDGCLYSNSKKVITVSDTVTTNTDGIMSSTDKTKLNSIAAGAEVNVQSDWNVTDSTSDAFIKNKPTIPTIPTKNVIYNTHTNGEVAKFDTTTGTITASGYTISKSVPSNAVFTDTKNTAGSTNSSSKLYLIGAASQAANPQTYSHDTAYVGTDGCLYSNSKKVITVSDTVTTTTDGIMSSEDKTKLDKIQDFYEVTVDLSSYTSGQTVNSYLSSTTFDGISSFKIGDKIRIKSDTTIVPSNYTPSLQYSIWSIGYSVESCQNNNGTLTCKPLGILRWPTIDDTDIVNSNYLKYNIEYPYPNQQILKYGGYIDVMIIAIKNTQYICIPLFNNSCGYISRNAINATTATNATNATNASKVYISTSSSSTSYPLVFTSSTTAGNKSLYTDSGNSLYYNPSTNTLTVPKLYTTEIRHTSGTNSTIIFESYASLAAHSYCYDVFNIKDKTTTKEYIKLISGTDGTDGTNSIIEVYGSNKTKKTVITGGSTALTSSDERLKDFLDDIPIDFNDLKQLPKKYFVWKDNSEGDLQIGTSAQAVEKIYPELVKTDENGYKSLEYAKLSIIALAAIDKLNERIEYLENKLKELE